MNYALLSAWQGMIPKLGTPSLCLAPLSVLIISTHVSRKRRRGHGCSSEQGLELRPSLRAALSLSQR